MWHKLFTYFSLIIFLTTLAPRSGSASFQIHDQARSGILVDPNPEKKENEYTVFIPLVFNKVNFSENDPPFQPHTPTPADGATEQSMTVDLSWTGGDPEGDTVTYDVYFEASNPPTTLVSENQTELTYDPGILLAEVQYYWKIIARDEHGETTDGPVWDFTTGAAPNQPPNIPSSPSPADGAAEQSLTVDMSWTGGDPEGDTVTYDVYFEASNPPTTLVSENQTETTYDPGILLAEVQYYWKIIARDEHGETTDGLVWNFTTGAAPNQPPNIPSSPCPADGATEQSLEVDLSWTGGDPEGDTVTYDVYFEASNPPTALVSENQTETTYEPGILLAEVQYYWKIIARDEHGETTDGPIWDFTTAPKRVDLAITKTDLGLTIEPGEVLTYTITYSNTGELEATGIVISDTIPLYTSLNNDYSSLGWQRVGSTNVYTYFVDTLTPKQYGTLQIGVNLIDTWEPDVLTITNTVQIANDLTHGDELSTENNTSQVSTPVNAYVDLAIDKSDQGVMTQAGDTITYTLTYTNAGNQAAAGVVISDTLPENTSFNAALSTSGWQQVAGSNSYHFEVGELSVDESGAVRFVVNVDDPLPEGTTAIYNQTSIGDDQAYGVDPNLENNSDQTSTLVPSGPTEVCGTIDTDTVWTAVGNPYVVTCDVSVNTGVTLSIQPGVIVKFNSTTRSLIVNGLLNVQGEVGNPVYFTSYKDDSVGGDTNNDGSASTPDAGDWNGISVVSSGEAFLSYTTIQYGGYLVCSYSSCNGLGAELKISSNALAILDNVTIRQSQSRGIKLDGNIIGSKPQVNVTNSEFYDNVKEGIGSNSESDVSTLLNITNSSFSNNERGISISGSNSLTVTQSTFNNNGHGIYDSSARYIDLSGNTFTNNSSSAATLKFDNGTFVSNSSNLGTGNGTNGIVISGSFGQDTTLPLNHNFPYILTNYSLTINDGVTLTLPPGTIFKSEGVSSNSLIVKGVLSAQGTNDSKIFFTSLKDDSVGGDTNNDGSASTPDAGDWGAIVNSSGGEAIIDYVKIKYGGHGYTACSLFGGCNDSGFDGSIQVYGNSSLIINHSMISMSENAGIYIKGENAFFSVNESSIFLNGSPDFGYYHYDKEGIYFSSEGGIATVNNSIIQNNLQYGVYSNGNMIISNCNISNNGTYGVRNANTFDILVAKNNYWGSDSGPAPYGSGNGINYRTCYDSELGRDYICEYYVDVSPWLGQASTYGQDVQWQGYEADPVNTATGNYAYQRTDISIPTRSLPLELRRSYNSAEPQDGSMGFGWTHSYNMLASESSVDGSITIRFGDGHEERYTWNGSSYEPPAGVNSSLENSGDLFNLTLKEQTIYNFDSLGRLSGIADKNGNLTTLAYTGTLLDQIIAPNGRMLVFTYTPESRISQIEDPLDRTIQYGYNITGELSVVTDTMGIATNFSYDSQHRMLNVTDGNGHTFVSNIYDSNGRVIEQRDAQANLTSFYYDLLNHQTIVTDPLTRTNVYQYDTDLRLISKTDGLDETEYFTHDEDNNRISWTDRRDHLTTYSYDDFGNTLVITDTLGGVQTFSYDEEHNLLSASDANGYTTTYSYDSHGNRLSVTNPISDTIHYTYYAAPERLGLLASSQDGRGHTTLYDYNLQGDLNQITDPLSNTTEYTYDLGGRRLTVTDSLGNTTTNTYDAANRILSQTDELNGITVNIYDPVGNLINEIDPLGRVITHTYNVKDQLISTEDTGGYITSYSYDSVGNRISLTDGNLHTSHYEYDVNNQLIHVIDSLDSTTVFAYDPNGNRISVTDPLSKTTSYSYDPLNRQTHVIDSLNHVITTTYDAVGNILSTIDANQHTNSFIYDEANRLIQVNDALSGTVTYDYDANDNRIKITDANSHIITYTYNAQNQLIETSDPLGNLTSYTYDAAGNRITTTDPKTQTTTYKYDELYHLGEILYDDGSKVNYAYDEVGNRLVMTDTTGVTNYAYDDLDRPITIVSPQGSISYTYDAVNRLTLTTAAGTTTYTYNAADQLQTVTDWNSRTTTYTYDDAGRQIGIAYPNDVTAAKTYDNADRLTEVSYDRSGILETFTYTLDAAGNRLSMTDADGVTNYTYDDLNRVTSVTYPSGTPASVSYTYDPMGNRLTMTEDSVYTTYAYNAADRMLNFVTDGITTTLTWDNNGNMLTKGTQTFTWDSADRMVALTNVGTNATYQYDGDGVRVERMVDGQLTIYLQDLASGLPLVLRETTAGTPVDYVYGTDLLESVNASAIPSFYHADGLGSTRLLSNNSGVVTDRYSYDAFGATRSHTGSSGQTFTFTGEQLDPEAVLVFLRARYYDPEVGRFISIDMQSGLEFDIQGLNRFAYVQNNPLRYIDAEGEFVITAIAVGIVGYTAYKTISAWSGFLDNTQRFKNSLKVHYSGDFANPEWQRNEDALPKTIQTTLESAKYAAVTTPGTSLTGKMPTRLDWTVPLNFTLKKLFLPSLKKPQPNRVKPFEQRKSRSYKYTTIRNMSVYYDYYYTGNNYYCGGIVDGGGSSWSTPPSQDK